MNSNIFLHLVSHVMRHKSKIYGVANATLKNSNVFMRNYDAVKFKLPHLHYVLLAFIWPLKKNKPMEMSEVKNPDTIESVLKSADDLFDSSNYEKCFQLLIKKIPESETEWKEIAEEFETIWNFSHCVGACDGKHIAIEKPPGSGSLFYNYKGFFSIVLFAVVNANYEFMYVHTGTNGSVADGAILKSTKFYKKMINNSLNLPSPSPLAGTNEIVPYVLLGDSAFALSKNLMKPFPFKNINREQRIFNYRLSRARRVVENAFGILSSRFRILRRPLDLDLDNVDAVVLACCALHNFLRKRVPSYISHSHIDSENIKQGTFHEGDWRHSSGSAPLVSLQRSSNTQRNEDGNSIRNKFKDYFNSAGRVSFQDRMIDVVTL